MKTRWGLFFLAGLLLFPALGSAVPGYMLARMGTMEGQVFVDGKPAKGVVLTFFRVDKGLPPIAEGGMGRIPEQLDRADDEGRFQVKLVEGSYYLGILFRPLDGRPGPPRKGERYYFADGGHGKLRQLAIADFKRSEVGRIDCSLPSVFKEDEDHFTVEGVVLRGAGANDPLEDALVLAKKSAEAMRPEYFSAATAKDGKFSIKLPPGQTFYLVARASITGAKPNPGEDIGKLGVDQDVSQRPAVNFSGTPSPPSEDFLNKVGARGQINDTAIAVSGKKGEVISGLKIHMFKMPDGQAIREARQSAAAAFGQGAASTASQSGIEFARDSDALTPAALAELEGWAKNLSDHKEITIEIRGTVGSDDTHTFARSGQEGDPRQKLSARRVVAVQGYLQHKGVGAARIKVIGQGGTSDQPGGSGPTAPAVKGRVDISVVEKN